MSKQDSITLFIDLDFVLNNTKYKEQETVCSVQAELFDNLALILNKYVILQKILI